MTLPPPPPAPSRVPAAHFAVGLLFLAAALVGLVRVAPDLAQGHFLRGRVVATAHLFTLGWFTTVIYGALGLFVPSAVGGPVWPPRLRAAILALHAAGVPAMAVGLAAGHRGLLMAGVTGVGTGVVLVCGLLLRSALRGTGDRRLRGVLAAAGLFLVAAFLMGWALAENLHGGFLGTSRLRVVGIHLHTAALGWILMVILAAGRRVLPMFLMAHGVPSRGWDRAALLVGSGMGLLVLGHHLPWWRGVVLVAGGLAWLGVLAFVVQVATLVRHRGRALEPGMGWALGGVAVMAAALVPSLLWLLGWSHPRLMPLWVVGLLLGGFTPFVLGHARRMLPFQLWSLAFAAAGGGRRLPPVDGLLSRRVGWATAAVAGAGMVLLLFGVAAGEVLPLQVGGWLVALGTGGAVAELLSLGLRFFRTGFVLPMEGATEGSPATTGG